MKITLCGSIAFYDEMIITRELLIEQGHDVRIPPSKVTDPEGKIISIKDYYSLRKATKPNESWLWTKKGVTMHSHFDKVAWSDAILVLNYSKNNITNYVGANSLIEMGLAFHLGKTIYLLNPIPEMTYKEEILAVQPTILYGNFNLIESEMVIKKKLSFLSL